MMLRPPKQKFKESAEAEFVPSAAIFAILMLYVRALIVEFCQFDAVDISKSKQIIVLYFEFYCIRG